jgi:hypothetical protein
MPQCTPKAYNETSCPRVYTLDSQGCRVTSKCRLMDCGGRLIPMKATPNGDVIGCFLNDSTCSGMGPDSCIERPAYAYDVYGYPYGYPNGYGSYPPYPPFYQPAPMPVPVPVAPLVNYGYRPVWAYDTYPYYGQGCPRGIMDRQGGCPPELMANCVHSEGVCVPAVYGNSPYTTPPLQQPYCYLGDPRDPRSDPCGIARQGAGSVPRCCMARCCPWGR